MSKQSKNNKNAKSKKLAFNNLFALFNFFRIRISYLWSLVKPKIKKYSGYAFRIFSILVVSAIFLWVGALFLPLLNAASSTGNYSLDDVTPRNPSRPTINIQLGEPDWSGKKPFVETKFDPEIELPQMPLWEEGGCFIYLYNREHVEKDQFTEPVRYGRGGEPQTPLNPIICFDGSNKRIYTTSNPNWINGTNYTFISGRPPYYYPFDWAVSGVRTSGTKRTNS